MTHICRYGYLHQHQRPIQHAGSIAYIEVTLADIALANRLAGDVLGRSLDDLPPQTRRVLGEVVTFVEQRQQAQGLTRSQVRFTRRELRDATGTGDTQLKLHLGRLEDHEYLIVHRQGPRYQYELMFDGDPAGAHRQLIGLVDVAALTDATTANRSGETRQRSAPDRGLAGAVSGGGRSVVMAGNARSETDSPPLVAALTSNARPEVDARPARHSGTSYRPARSA